MIDGWAACVPQDMRGMVDILNQGDTKGLFGDIADLPLDAKETTTIEEGLQTSDTFKVYNTTDRKSKLYLVNDEQNHKKILTFEIPLDLPECKSVTEDGTTTVRKIDSFMVYIDAKHSILDNGYLESK